MIKKYVCLKSSLGIKEGNIYDFEYKAPYYICGDINGYHMILISIDNGQYLIPMYTIEPGFISLEKWREQQIDKILNS